MEPQNVPLAPEMRPGATLYTDNRQTTEVGRKLGEGLTGVVYEIPQEPDYVIKVYFPSFRTPLQEGKLRHEVKNPPRDTTREQYSIPSLTWPVEVYQTQRGQFCGFKMYKKPANTFNIETAYDIVPRKTKFPSGFNYYYQLFAAYNFAMIVKEASDAGYVMGDGINEKNVQIGINALVVGLDDDSWQVPDDQGNVLYRCTEGQPLWTPPELVGAGDFETFDQYFYNDNYRLAMGEFRLLMLGFDPVGGGWKVENGQRRTYDKDEFAVGVKEGFSMYYPTDEAHRLPTGKAPPKEILPPQLEAIFDKTFRTGRELVDSHGHVLRREPDPHTRPVADDHVDALRDILFPTVNGQVVSPIGRTLSVCAGSRNHIYSSHLDQGRQPGHNCPWHAYMRTFNPPKPEYDPYAIT